MAMSYEIKLYGIKYESGIGQSRQPGRGLKCESNQMRTFSRSRYNLGKIAFFQKLVIVGTLNFHIIQSVLFQYYIVYLRGALNNLFMF